MKKLLLASVSTIVLLSANGVVGHQAEAAGSKKLDEKSKIALAYFTKDIGTYSFTKKEILSGHYALKFPAGTTIKDSKTFDLYKLNFKIKGAPKDMKFYSTKDARGNFFTIIGVSDRTILTSGTQYDAPYDALVSDGKKYNMADYKKYMKTNDFKKIVSKIKFVKKPR